VVDRVASPPIEQKGDAWRNLGQVGEIMEVIGQPCGWRHIEVGQNTRCVADRLPRPINRSPPQRLGGRAQCLVQLDRIDLLRGSNDGLETACESGGTPVASIVSLGEIRCGDGFVGGTETDT